MKVNKVLSPQIAGKVSHNPQMQAKGTQRAHGETTVT